MTFSRHELKRDEVTVSWLDNALSTAPETQSVVFLHGLAGSAREWGPVAEALAPDFRAIVVDLRGHGHSSRRPADTTRRAFVDDVAAVISEVSPSAPVHVVGQSMGGHTGMLLAAWHPHIVDRLVLLEATVAGFDPDAAKRLGDYFRSWNVPFESRASAALAMGGSSFAQAVAADLEERSDGFWPRFDPDVMQAAMESVSEPRWLDWAAISGRVLAVFAENGYFTPDDRRAFIAARAGTEERELAGVGHDAHLEAPAAWLSVLAEFLSRP
jgi:pimeloyl-ACP methyl ester carboxylesterase